ncbi:MAG: riboflavin kinase [Terracidiphilus sp.]
MKDRTSALGTAPRPECASWPCWARSLDLRCTFKTRYAFAGWRFQAPLFARWLARGTFGVRDGCWGGRSRCCQRPRRGGGIGARLLVPTVNLAHYDGLLPAFGVYVTRLKVDGRVFQAVDECGKPADIRRAVLCGRVVHS